MLVDANLPLDAKMRRMPQHAPARQPLEEALDGPERVGLPCASLLAFFGW